jgi:PAS domain S-box-containing protein
VDSEGNEMILQVYKFPLGPSKGPKMLGGIAIDITEITRARERIIRERDLSDSIINSLPGVFYLFDANGKYLRWNKQLETTSGYSAAEIAQMHPTDFFRGEFAEAIAAEIAKVFETGASHAEADFITKDGKSIPYYFTGQLVSYNNSPCVIGTGIDVTDRKKAEARLMRSEEKYRTLVEQAIDAIALYDSQGRILDVNTGAVSLLGYSKEELSTMTLDQVLTPEEWSANPIRYDVLEKGESTVKNRKMRKKNGAIVVTEVRSQQLPDGRYLSVIRDLSERIRTREELESSYRAIRELTAHLQNIREEERTHIAREIHDELGQQLTVLKMDVSWINKKIIDNADDTTRDKMKELLSMLDDTVKTVRRISSELRPSLLDDLGLVAAMEWQLREFEKRSGIKTTIESPEVEVELSNAVKTALFRIFQESLTNVARHSEAQHVRVALTGEPGQFVMSIEDDGRGFEKDIVAEKKTLGLLGMTERTTMIGGSYEIVSAPGQGTRVSVTVPLGPDEYKQGKDENFDR